MTARRSECVCSRFRQAGATQRRPDEELGAPAIPVGTTAIFRMLSPSALSSRMRASREFADRRSAKRVPRFPRLRRGLP